MKPIPFLLLAFAACSPAFPGDSSKDAVADQPVLGFVQDVKGGALRAILGVPDSPRFSDPISLPEGLTLLAIAPGHEWALVVRENETGALELPSLRYARIADGRADKVAFSPSGRDVALYSESSGAGAVHSGLPAEPRAGLRFETALAIRIAVSDGGRAVVCASRDAVNGTSESGSAYLGESAAFTDFAFVPDSQSLLAYDRQSGTLTEFRDALEAGSARRIGELAPGMDLLAVGRDAITLAKSAGGVAMLDRDGAALRAVETPPIQSLQRMRLRSLRLLSHQSGEPAWLLLADGGLSGVPAVREVAQ